SSSLLRPPPRSTLFPYTTLFRSSSVNVLDETSSPDGIALLTVPFVHLVVARAARLGYCNVQELGTATWQLGSQVATVEADGTVRSEEHTSELQSRENLVCRLLLE